MPAPPELEPEPKDGCELGAEDGCMLIEGDPDGSELGAEDGCMLTEGDPDGCEVVHKPSDRCTFHPGVGAAVGAAVGRGLAIETDK